MPMMVPNQNSISFGPVNYASRETFEKPYISKGPEQRIPLPYHLENGEVVFSLYYPNAREVTIRRLEGDLQLTPCNDLWIGTMRLNGSFASVQVLVDGNEVLSPTLPIGYSCNLPFNYVEVPSHLLYEIQDVPHGSICQEFIHNSVTGLWERIQLYLPAEYHQSPERDYPVLYLQHGYGENETVWVTQGKLNFLLDNLIAQQKAVPMIVVMCCGMMVSQDGTHSAYDRFDRFLLHDVIPHVKARYRIRSDRESNAMAGLSMGSIQTSRTVLLNPEMFKYMGLFSGFFADILSGNSDHLAPQWISRFKEAGIHFYRAIGAEDPYYADFEADSCFIAENNISCDTFIFSGGHEWNVWRKCLEEFVQYIFTGDFK